MNSLAKIKSIIVLHKAEMKEKYHLSNIGVFGSWVRNEQSSTSDLDILVEFSDPPGLFKFIEMENYLSALLGSKVDLVMKSALKPTIGKQILSELELI